MNWKNVETWEEAAKTVADLIEENERLRWVEQQLPIYRRELTERSAQLVRAIRLLQEEGINFEMEDIGVDWRNVFRELVQTATAEEDFSTWKEVKAKAHASGDLAELLNDELNQKENDSE
tara:strand:- start:459 stop:818 length:360 start_codon:yes stop_codon:yes gene_type:complete